MTKKLEEIFNIENQEPVTEEDAKQSIPIKKDFIQEVDSAIDKIDTALPRVRDLDDTSDKELDDLADLATDKFNDLMDLGMNVDSRFSGNIFQTASQLLGHAITAKTSKIDKKLKALDLDLKRRRLEMQEKQAKLDNDDEPGFAQELDRNALLEMLRNKDDVK